MASALLVVLCVSTFFCGYFTAKLPSSSCGINERWSQCPSACALECPTSEDYVAKRCTSPEECPKEACECLFNHRRSSNGTCIPVRECPPFECSRPNERYDPCPPLCPSDDCSQATPDGRCPVLFGRIGIVLTCTPKCRCVEGFWRRNGVCVPYDQCHKTR